MFLHCAGWIIWIIYRFPTYQETRAQRAGIEVLGKRSFLTSYTFYQTNLIAHFTAK